MSAWPRRFGTIIILFALILILFVYLPIPGLTGNKTIRFDDPGTSPEGRTKQFFEVIGQSRNLNRPFPAMQVRPDNPATAEKVELGRLLYFDPVLSGDNRLSCAHCHHPDLGFSDNLGQSMGIGGEGLGRNRRNGARLRRGSPTVWNAAYNHRQFWDGRAADLEDQAGKPIQDEKEMAQDPQELLKELEAIPGYQTRFVSAFGLADASGIRFEHVTYAIAAFERSLLSQNSRFDKYARGEMQSLAIEERRGLNVFRSLKTRCFECHNLPTFANPDFKVIGVPDLDPAEPDLGHGELAGEAYHRAFKVPTLRNVALTAPYMHNGIFATLDQVIDFYSAGGGPGRGMEVPNVDDKIRPFEISATEKANLISFLHTLTDESAKPQIPESVPSGLPVVPHLSNQSPELAAYNPPALPAKAHQLRKEGRWIFVSPRQRIQDGIDMAQPGDTVLVMPGIYHETLTLDISNIHLSGSIGENGERPVLDGQNLLSDGLIGSGSNITISDLVFRNYTANSVMIDGGVNISFINLYCENPGLYGVYPVGCINVLVDGCTVTGARDAGIYVGQCREVLVRNSTAFANVTGIEIENCINAVVENNEAYNNTGGVLVFLLPNNPSKVSNNCRVINNRIYDNNHLNFADPTAIVATVPPGSGIMILAADSVEITHNDIRDNNSFGVAMVHLDMVYGAGSSYDVDPAPDNNRIHDNLMLNNGSAPAGLIRDNGFDGKDLLWDLSGTGNNWDQENATRLPPALPGSEWSDFRRRANFRLWTALMAL